MGFGAAASDRGFGISEGGGGDFVQKKIKRIIFVLQQIVLKAEYDVFF